VSSTYIKKSPKIPLFKCSMKKSVNIRNKRTGIKPLGECKENVWITTTMQILRKRDYSVCTLLGLIVMQAKECKEETSVVDPK
jgi:hypothetical protein